MSVNMEDIKPLLRVAKVKPKCSGSEGATIPCLNKKEKKYVVERGGIEKK